MEIPELQPTLPSPREGSGDSGHGSAIALAIIAGVLTPMLNYALAFRKPVLQRALDLGSKPANTTYSVWVIVLLGGLPADLLYCAYLMGRNKTWSAFRARTYDWRGGCCAHGHSMDGFHRAVCGGNNPRRILGCRYRVGPLFHLCDLGSEPFGPHCRGVERCG